MKIIIEKEIENCYECPFHSYVSEQGYCGDECKYISYGTIPEKGILKNCPFKKKEREE